MKQSLKVLVAEDEPVSLRLLTSYLDRWGYQVSTARSGLEAWSRFRSARFDIVISDWMMPGLDGLELIRRIRSSERPGYVYILLLTARTQREDLLRGLDAGADDFMTKPFDRDELRVRLRSGERLIRLEQQLQEQNRLLEASRQALEERVQERTAELALAHEAVRNEAQERARASQELAAAQRLLLEAEREKKLFYREVIRAVTKDRLCLVEPHEVPREERMLAESSLQCPSGLAEARNRVRELALQAGMGEEATEDLLLAAGEAAANAVKHATGGRSQVYTGENRLVVRVSDTGPGIRPENLPASVLTPGYSTQVSLGMGFTLMLQLVDRVWLATGPEGTTLQLEKWVHPPIQREDAALAALVDRF